MNRTLVSLLIAVALAATALTGCSPDEATPEASTPKTPVTPAPEPEPVTPGLSATDPVPLGTAVRVGDWDITVTGATLDASATIAAASEYNKPAAAGSQYVLVQIRGVYKGTTAGTLWIDLLYSYMAPTGTTYDGTDSFAVSPSPISAVGQVLPEAEVTGDLLFEVPAADVADGLLLIEDFMALEGNGRFFFAVQ